MRIALFGGSFNPPHVAHQFVLSYVLATARPRIDQIWMIPTFAHPFAKLLVPYSDRVAMCALAAQPFGASVQVSQIEAELAGESYTVRTVQTLQARHPEHTFVLVVGADLLKEFERWLDWPTLRDLLPQIVVGRKEHAGGDVELPAISSTAIRSRVEKGESIDALVPAAVVDYIRAHGLYR